MTSPPFPVDDSTLDLLDNALTPAEDGRSSVNDLCVLFSELAGSDTTAITEQVNDDTVVMRDLQYHPYDIIAALITEVRRLRRVPPSHG